MTRKGTITEDREMLVMPVVRDVAIMQSSVSGGGIGGMALRTKAGGYILTKSGSRIKTK